MKGNSLLLVQYLFIIVTDYPKPKDLLIIKISTSTETRFCGFISTP